MTETGALWWPADEDLRQSLRGVISQYGMVCPECGRLWLEPSPRCPHYINDLHPASSEDRPQRSEFIDVQRYEAIRWWITNADDSAPFVEIGGTAIPSGHAMRTANEWAERHGIAPPYAGLGEARRKP